MITLHFNHSNMEIPEQLLIDIADKIKSENYGVFVQLIHTIADNCVRKIYGHISAYPVWEYKSYNKINIDVFVVGHEPLKISLDSSGCVQRFDDSFVKLTVEDMKGLLRFFHRHGQHDQIAKLIEMPNDDDETPF